VRAALVLVSCMMLGEQTAPPRDPAAATAARPATLRGRVVTGTGEPLHRVRVVVNSGGSNQPSDVTDTRGDFEIVNVPPGSHTITASRSGYLTIQYGQRRPREAGRSVEIKPGEVIDGIAITLPGGAVLAGTMTDDVGDVYPGVRVEAVEYRYVRGRRLPVQAGAATTNDIGQYRISGLAPGTYMLRASSIDTWEGDDGGQTSVYAHTYFPGVTAQDQAQLVPLGVAQTVANLNFALRPGRPATITGLLQNASGEPMDAQSVTLSRATRGVGGALSSTGGPGGQSARTNKDGAFTFRNVPPGEYVVTSCGSADLLAESVVVADGETKSVTLAARKPSSLSGVVVTDDGVPPPWPLSQLRVLSIATDAESLFPSFTGAREAAVNRDGTFRFANINGQYVFRVAGLPPDWMLSGVVLADRNYVDAPLELAPGGIETKGMRLVVSKTAGAVTGEVVSRDRKPAPDSTVISRLLAPKCPTRYSCSQSRSAGSAGV
jgi:hypothetical protein